MRTPTIHSYNKSDDLEQETPPTKKEFLEGLERSVELVKEHTNGKIYLKNAFDLINEL